VGQSGGDESGKMGQIEIRGAKISKGVLRFLFSGENTRENTEGEYLCQVSTHDIDTDEDLTP
jgi:hypothetical protein